MKTLCFIILAGFSASMAHAGVYHELPGNVDSSAIPAPSAVEMPRSGGSGGVIAACPRTMTGDASIPCFIATRKTTVCADGQKINTARVTAKDVKSGKYGSGELGKYKNKDLLRGSA
jgi:hypothetical protein